MRLGQLEGFFAALCRRWPRAARVYHQQCAVHMPGQDRRIANDHDRRAIKDHDICALLQ
jgi:hypothetical protein